MSEVGELAATFTPAVSRPATRGVVGPANMLKDNTLQVTYDEAGYLAVVVPGVVVVPGFVVGPT